MRSRYLQGPPVPPVLPSFRKATPGRPAIPHSRGDRNISPGAYSSVQFSAIQDSMSPRELKQRKRNDYGYILEYRTRWSDNDMTSYTIPSSIRTLFRSVVYTHQRRAMQPSTTASAVLGELYFHVGIALACEHNVCSPSGFTFRRHELIVQHRYGLVVHSHGDFFGSIGFPAVADLALRVNKLGRTSVTYEVALFERGVEDVKSVGELVHVFVDRETGRPAAQGMESKLRDGLQKIQVKQSKL
ncbi:hypothetical protein JHW43_006063 [Diplocarpon mali]|nr:hypothetical protein JHW43_006063 [Diplocarpon mali]